MYNNFRQQASLLAIHNAKQKAQEMARLVHQAVGRPLSVREEENKEWNGSNETLEDIESVKSVQQRVENATISISSKVFVTYELKPKIKKKTIS